LINSAERFFELLVALRQASLYFRITPTVATAQRMLCVRRDVVAAILMNLWILAGGLRAKTPVPRYLPSAAMARRALLVKLQETDLDVGGFDGNIPMRFQRREEQQQQQQQQQQQKRQSVGEDGDRHDDSEEDNEDKVTAEGSSGRSMGTGDRRKNRWRVIYGMSAFPF